MIFWYYTVCSSYIHIISHYKVRRVFKMFYTSVHCVFISNKKCLTQKIKKIENKNRHSLRTCKLQLCIYFVWNDISLRMKNGTYLTFNEIWALSNGNYIILEDPAIIGSRWAKLLVKHFLYRYCLLMNLKFCVIRYLQI